MTCEDCIHIQPHKEIDKDFNTTTLYLCGKYVKNIKLVKEFSETFRLKNPHSPLNIIYYDNSKKDCPHHKVGAQPLDRYMPKSNGTKETKEVKTELPKELEFLERD